MAALITPVGIAIVGLSRTAQLMLSLLFATFTYAVLSIAVNWILSPILTEQH